MAVEGQWFHVPTVCARPCPKVGAVSASVALVTEGMPEVTDRLPPGVAICASLTGVADLGKVIADLAAEGDDLDAIVAALPSSSWSASTPAPGWDIARQVAHLAWTDEVTTVAITDADAFAGYVEAALADIDGYVDACAAEVADTEPAALLGRWRAGRKALTDALASVPDGQKLPWFGPPMSATSMATARLMETWAHGQDIADALGVERVPTSRLRNIAHIGVRTRDFAYGARLRTPPSEPFFVALDAPDGDTWTWGPEDAAQRVHGPALDFCLLVTQRRHRDDLALVAEGADADEWLTIAQAFAGPPGAGRAPGEVGGRP